ncbi:paralemmin 1a [Diretmus argenteus]
MGLLARTCPPLAGHVSVRGGRTFCYPGACVKDITSSALQVLNQHSSAAAVVLEAGLNDLKYQQSELLKEDFTRLAVSLLDTVQLTVQVDPEILVRLDYFYLLPLNDDRACEGLSQQERLQIIAEKRKWQTEIENKKRQLEDDRRALQHLKSKALRERWLLDGAPSAGPEQDEARKQLEQDEAKTRNLEETISGLEQELEELETGGSVITHTIVKVKVHKSPRLNKSSGPEEMKRAMYSVQIKVERDKVTGETKVLSSNTLLPVDLCHQGVKVYEDEQKVVHEMNGENNVHQLSSSEVDDLIHKADEASMMSQTVPTVELHEGPQEAPEPPREEITGLEAKPGVEPGIDEASTEKPVTMVFMGYQSVEDEAETKKVLGLEGTVKAELVLIEDGDGKTSPVGNEEGASAKEVQMAPPPPNGSASSAPPPAKAQETPESNSEKTGEPEGGATEISNKEKQPCKCCTIM